MPERHDYDYLIIGGGMVADSAARGIRERDSDGSIGIIALEEDPPATRPALTKKLWTDPEFTFDKIWLHTEEETGATRHGGLRATRIHATAKTVETDGDLVFGYDTLLLATGGTPHTLDLPHDERVVYFRSVEDYRRLRGLAGAGHDVAVIGGSFIGTELAAALAQNETAVMLVFPEDVLGGAVFPPELATRFQKLYADAGVMLLPGATLERGNAGPVRLELNVSTGDSLEVDAVVVGLGIEPNVDIARDAQLEVDDGVVVDDRLRTSDPSIFAAGDIASYPDAILGRRRIEHVDNATAMGACAGRNMTGADEPYDHTPYFYSAVFGNRYEAVGTLDSSWATVEEWNGSRTAGVVYYLHDGAVAGVLLWNVPDQLDAARAVIDSDETWDAATLRARIPLPSDDD